MDIYMTGGGASNADYEWAAEGEVHCSYEQADRSGAPDGPGDLPSDKMRAALQDEKVGHQAVYIL